MKPPAFEYCAPTTVEEALAHLAEYGYDAKVLAGGQSLIPTMNFRLAQPAVLVDLNNISELFYIRPNDDGGVRIGAMTRQSQVERDPLVAERAPLVHETIPHIAHLADSQSGHVWRQHRPQRSGVRAAGSGHGDERPLSAARPGRRALGLRR